MACCVAIAYLFGLVMRPLRRWFGVAPDRDELQTATYGGYPARRDETAAG